MRDKNRKEKDLIILYLANKKGIEKMELKEKILLEEVCGQTFRIRLVEASDNGKAAFTHYLHNHQNGASKFYKKEAITHVCNY